MANDENIKPYAFTKDQSREAAARNGKKGGIASGKRRKERKTVADALRMVLDEPIAKGSRQTRLDGISIKVVKKLFDDPDIRDMKVLAEILGELKQTINAEGLTLNITASEEGKGNIEKIMNGE